MRLIDADKLEIKFLNIGTVMFPKIRPVIYLEDVENASTIDAEPVVRCKYCKYSLNFYGQKVCSLRLAAINEDSYCSNGTKRNEEV